jgi:hypothetical protein
MLVKVFHIMTLTTLTHYEYRIWGEHAGIETKICHTFRATAITEYLRNGSKLEVAQ